MQLQFKMHFFFAETGSNQSTTVRKRLEAVATRCHTETCRGLTSVRRKIEREVLTNNKQCIDSGFTPDTLRVQDAQEIKGTN